MFVERYFVEGLAHASYLFGKDGEAAVVDPKRDVDDYLAAAERHRARIVAIFETHPHADFVSGHLELSQRTGAPIYVSRALPAEYPHRDLAHGDTLTLGGLRVTGLETPGHSPDSMSFYVEDGDERAVFTGDLLFVGDVGRPDLRDMHADPRAMAAALHDSLREVLYRLPDDTVVWPAHGAGSLCGRRLGAAPSTTIGAEKIGNWTNALASKEAFIEAMVANLPDRPLFFFESPFVNLKGAGPLADVPHPPFLAPADLRDLPPDVVVLDTRPGEVWAAAHLRGSLHVGLDFPVFSTWVGTLLWPETPLILVLAEAADADKARLDLARIGYENLRGAIVADPGAWRAAGLEVVETPQLEATCVEAWAAEGRVLLDVRTPGEWEAGSVPGALWIPLARLTDRLREVPPGPVAVMCGSGFRSAIAASVLERAGREQVVNLRGGYAAYARHQEDEPDTQDLFCRALFDRMPAPAGRR